MCCSQWGSLFVFLFLGARAVIAHSIFVKKLTLLHHIVFRLDDTFTFVNFYNLIGSVNCGCNNFFSAPSLPCPICCRFFFSHSGCVLFLHFISVDMLLLYYVGGMLLTSHRSPLSHGTTIFTIYHRTNINVVPPFRFWTICCSMQYGNVYVVHAYVCVYARMSTVYHIRQSLLFAECYIPIFVINAHNIVGLCRHIYSVIF